MPQLTEIQLFKNTPFTDFQNTIHFDSNNIRDAFFDEHYTKIKLSTNFNFVKDRLVLRARVSTLDTYGVNYMRFRNSFEGGRWYYCFVMSTEYLNDGVTQFGLVVDTVMTFCQGEFNEQLANVNVTRQSLTTTDFNKYGKWLLANDDVLTYPKQYTHQIVESWSGQFVLFTCSVNLKSDFGTEKDPKLKTSSGQTYDGVTSPVNLYATKSPDDFTQLMNTLQDYPWIAQNISNIAIVPNAMVDQNDMQRVTGAKNEHINIVELYTFKNNAKTKTQELTNLAISRDRMLEFFGLPSHVPDWLLREQYFNIEMTAWQGQTVSLDPAYLPSDGIKIFGQSTFGYHNEIRIFPDRYKSDGENSVTGLYRGTYANNGLIFDNFDDIPILIDNYKLAKANTAHQRELGNSRTITGRIQSVMNPNSNINDRFFNAVSLTTGLMGGVAKNALGQFTSEYEHYRTQRAELADKAISAPSVSSQNNSQAFNIAHTIYGVTLKFASIGDNYKRIMIYHNAFGFDFGGQIAKVYSVSSLPKMNYLQFTGNWTLPNVPSQFMQQLKVTFENGVKLWKNNNTDNPFKQDLSTNFI